MLSKKYLLLTVVLVVLLFLGAIGYIADVIWGANVPEKLEKEHFFVRSNTTFDQLSNGLKREGFIGNINSFVDVSKLMKFGDGKIKPGKYKVTPKMSNRNLISLLRSGNQVPVALTFNNIRTLEEFASTVGKQIELDSNTIMNVLNDPKTLEKWNTDIHNVINTFQPDTYEVYWSVRPAQLFEKLKKASDTFWKDEMIQNKLDALKMTREEVSTLASIVQKETLKNDEKPRVAGVYLNRLKRGMLLQADPTIVFALKQFDLKRILNKHLVIDSPFNTYKYQGLPPGPICMPEKSSIEAVLNAENHNFLYFCAKPDYSGYHNFSKNLIQHNKYAKTYHRWLNSQKIK